MDKRELRKEVNDWFEMLSHREIREMSRAVSERMIEEDVWKKSRQILLFLTFGKELETEFLLEAAFSQGKFVAVPRIYGKEMKFHYLQSMDDRVETNRWDIREPLADTPAWNPERGHTLMLAPGLAFDLRGERLGRGGGFYDRYLNRFGEKLFTAGICFEYQLREEIPAETYDWRIDGVCTEKRFLMFTPEKEFC